jgi:hypothetical protein
MILGIILLLSCYSGYALTLRRFYGISFYFAPWLITSFSIVITYIFGIFHQLRLGLVFFIISGLVLLAFLGTKALKEIISFQKN